MALTLTTREQELLAETQRALLSPLAYPDTMAWSRATSAPARSLLAAERGGLILPAGDAILCPDEGYDLEAIDAYPDLTREIDRRYRFLERAVRLGAYHRGLAWGPHLDDYYASSYYNDYIVPNRFFGVLGLAEPLVDGARIDTVAQLLLHREGEIAEDPERDVAILRLLLPAFRAGVHMWRQARDSHRELDAFSDGVLLVCRDGSVAHRNQAATRMLSNGHRSRMLAESAQEVARALASVVMPPELGSSHRLPNGGELHGYRLSASRVPAERYGHDVVGMICIQDTRETLPAPEDVQARHGLTPRQAEVALLLSRRLRNDEIAEALDLSPHTVKRHTEAVLMKLGVESRDDVRAALDRALDAAVTDRFSSVHGNGHERVELAIDRSGSSATLRS